MQGSPDSERAPGLRDRNGPGAPPVATGARVSPEPPQATDRFQDRRGERRRVGGDQIIPFSFHFAQMRFMAASACLSASSGVSAPVAALANMLFNTQVLNVSSMAALE